MSLNIQLQHVSTTEDNGMREEVVHIKLASHIKFHIIWIILILLITDKTISFCFWLRKEELSKYAEHSKYIK